ncbi:MAG: GAF domain-containing protein [Actinomycetia bacterium]|nr:GAF domain-containing protein [Actinomycetes bacterium]
MTNPWIARLQELNPFSGPGQWLAYGGPAAGLTLLAVLNRLVLVRLMPVADADTATVVLALLFTLVYSHAFLSRIKRQYAEQARLLAITRAQRDRLRLLHEAMTGIATERDVDFILRRVVELSRALTGARYGVLAIFSPEGTMTRFIPSGLSPEEIRAIGSLPRSHGLLGEVLRTRRPIRLDDIRQHPRSAGWPPNHPDITNFLGMPVLFRNQVVGHLYLTNKQDGPFTQADEDLVGLMASHAAVLISNARLNRELERLAVVEERQRISMELHDGTIQSLYGVMLRIDALLTRFADAPPAVRAVLDDLGDRLTRITGDIRHYVFDLKSASDDWSEAVLSIARSLGLADRTYIHAADRRFGDLSPRQCETVLGWLREALANVARHAHADRVDVTWRAEGEQFRVIVEDDGVGFVPEEPPPPGHFGLQHLARRARDLGGTFALASRPGQGTRVELTAPFALLLS